MSWTLLAPIAAVAVAGVAVLLQRRLEAARLDKLETDFRLLRTVLSEVIVFSRPELSDQAFVDALEALPVEQLKAAGLTILGTLITQVPERCAWGCFVDDTGTTFGCFTTAGGKIKLAELTTALEDGVVYTCPGKMVIPLGAPPTVVSQELPADASPSDLLAQHRRLIATLEQRRIVPVLTLDDVLREHPRLWAFTIRWRAAQNPDALLDHDLRAVLGNAYAYYAPVLKRRLLR